MLNKLIGISTDNRIIILQVLGYLLVFSFAHKSLAAPVESDQFYDAGNNKEDIIQLLAGYDIDKLRDMLSQSGVYHNLYNVSLNIAINVLVNHKK